MLWEALEIGRNDPQGAPSILGVSAGYAVFLHSKSHVLVVADFCKRRPQQSCMLSLASSDLVRVRHEIVP